MSTGPLPTSDELEVLRALAVASEAYAGSRRLEGVLNGLLATVLHLAQADAGSVMLLSPGRDRLEVVAARGPRADQIIGLSQPVDESVSGWVLHQGKTVVLQGPTPRQEPGDHARPASTHPRDLASSVVVPLRGGGDVLGVLSASRAPGTPRMDERTVHLIELLATQAAMVVDNVQLAERETATLRERAQLLELAFEAILVRDLATGSVSFWNPGAEELYGWTRDEIHGRDLHDLLATRFPRPRAEVEAELLRDGNWQGELVQTCRDGRAVIVSSRWALQRDERGQPVAVLEINRDITQAKQSEAQLQRQYRAVSLARSRVQAVLDATNEAIAFVSMDHQQLSVNRRFRELFLLEDGDSGAVLPAERVLSHLEQLLENPSTLQDLLLRQIVFDPDVELRRELVQLRPRRDLSLYSTPVRDEDGLRLGWLLVFRDVTAERAAERTKTEFFSMISHELRTPLTSITGYVELLLDREFGPLNVNQQQSLEIVRRNGEHLLALINDLLDVTRMMSGSMKVQPMAIDLVEVVAAAIDTLRPTIAAKGQQLDLDLPEAPQPLRGDPQRLRQVFVNLLSNAHKYTPAGGWVRVAICRDDEHLRVDVQDSGIGMTAEEQAQLFTRFFRADNPTTRQVGGTGLGLVITRSLVDMHQGRLVVTSAPGEGSTFSVFLPAELEPKPESESEPEPEPAILTERQRELRAA
jgi:PAS domain S-box-containing protein